MGQSRDSRPEPQGLAELFHEHAAGLAGAVRGVLGARADVAEVLQESFLRCWRARERGERPADPLAFVFVVTLNLAKDLRRAAARRGPDEPLEHADVIASTEPNPAARLAGREALAAARAAIARLGDEQREVFLLRVSAGLSFEAAAGALGIPVGTAKTRMRAALAALREALAPHAPNNAAPTATAGRDAR